MSKNLKSKSPLDAATCSLELADYLAHAIFAAGNEPHDRVQRIQFMGGKYPDRETNLGGYCREALRDCIKRAIDARPRFIPENSAKMKRERDQLRFAIREIRDAATSDDPTCWSVALEHAESLLPENSQADPPD